MSDSPSASPLSIPDRPARPSSHGVWLLQHDTSHSRGPQTSVGSRSVAFCLSDAEPSGDRLAVRTPRPLYLGLLTGPALVGQIDDADRGDAPLSLHPGESLVLAAGTPLTLTLPPSTARNTSCLVVAVDPRRVQEVLTGDAEGSASPSPASPTATHLQFSTPPGLRRLLESMAELFASTSPYHETLIALNAAELVVRLLQTEARPLLANTRISEPPRLADDRLGAAVQYARAHLDQPLSVRDLAEQACMSESSFYRHFREAVGMTPLQFLTHERIERARRLLAERTQTVSAVSQEVGFQSVSYFITTFKAHVGQTPKQYQLSATET